MEPNERPDRTELRDGFDRVAGDVDVPDADIARQQVHRRARRRATRTRVVAGLTAAAAVALGFVVADIAADPDAPTRIAEKPATESTLDDELVSPDSTDASPTTAASADGAVAPTTDVPTTDVPATDSVPTGGSRTPNEPAAVAGVVRAEMVDAEPVVFRGSDVAEPGGIEWVLPWHDGFLASVRPQQPLPDALPEEVVALFPQEVRDLFDGELPATIAEATEMLQEAGLLDEVTEVITNSQAASDAVYGAPMPDPEVQFSTDGTDWQPIEFALPDGFQPTAQAASTGGRLALLGIPSATRDDARQPVLLASTTDLATWDVVEVDPAEPPFAVPDTFVYRVWASSLAVSDDGWILSAEANLEPRFEAFLDDDVRPQGMSLNADGFTVMADDGTAVTVTWEETGAGPELLALLEDSGSYYASAVHTGTWDGAATSTPVEAGWGVATVNADGFYVVSAGEVLHSADGVSWTALPVPGQGWPEALFTVDGSIVLGLTDQVGSGAAPAELYVLDGPDGPWLRAEIPLPPAQFAVGRGGSADGAVALEQWSDPQSEAPITWVLASADGDRWLLDELPSSVDDVGHPHPIARNGSTVVVHVDGAWFAYELP